VSQFETTVASPAPVPQPLPHSDTAEKLLRDSEERYRASFEQAAVGILHTSLDGKIVNCNQRFAEIVGYAPNELIGASFQQITPPEDRHAGSSVAEQLLSGALGTASFEKRYLRKDGVLTWVLLTISIQRDGEGRPLHFLTIVQDIDARKETEQRLAIAQEALRASEVRYRTAFQMTLDGININRLSDGVFVECNESFLRNSGYARDEVIGHSPLEINIWADLRDREKLLDSLRRDGVCKNLEARFKKKNGELLWGLLSASIMEIDRERCLLAITRDITEAKAAEEEIRSLAFYDPLTQLPNRRLLLERLEHAVASGKRSGRRRALLFVDLDDFKTLNDTLGHHIGDLLLQEIARRLTSCIREADTAARLGGDEFVIMVENLSPESEAAAAQAKMIAEKILNCIGQPLMLAGRECHITSSIGITLFGDCNEKTGELLQQADIAMYQAKAAGRNTIHFFAPALQAAINARAALEDELRQAIRGREFLLWYQPQVERGRLIGAEALVRWDHPRRGILAPAEFIHLAEETGLILPLGALVLEMACTQLAEWSQRNDLPPITLAVNISARQFRQANFVDQVLRVLHSTGAEPARLKLEITESMLLDDVEETIAVMTRLKSHGVQFSLDDFGTGYSSLSYLKRLPLDQLKIDRTFVRDLLEDETSSAIAQTIVSLSGAMHLSLLAEGVETEEQLSWLTGLGCHAFQGYFFSPPVPAEKFQSLLGSLADRTPDQV
jgi:diguanylate cyclase (GGDEF)-like protein/PAS domain S-box-containing protein